MSRNEHYPYTLNVALTLFGTSSRSFQPLWAIPNANPWFSNLPGLVSCHPRSSELQMPIDCHHHHHRSRLREITTVPPSAAQTHIIRFRLCRRSLHSIICQCNKPCKQGNKSLRSFVIPLSSHQHSPSQCCL